MSKTQLIKNSRAEFIRIRPTKRKHKKDHKKERHLIPLINGYDLPMELCLCGRCAGAFYNLEDHIIRRVDYDQYFKDKCDYCGQRYGYDYLVYEREHDNPSNL